MTQKTTRKHVRKLADDKVAAGLITNEDREKLLNQAPRQPQEVDRQSRASPTFINSWKLDRAMAPIIKVVDQQVRKAPTDAARAEIGRELATVARVIVKDHAAIEDAEVVYGKDSA